MTKKSFKDRIEQTLGKFTYFLLYMILEWILIAILFVDGLIAFAANEFARFFELKIPCLLCTRIDHVLVRRSPEFYYNDSICESHRKDVSSLAYCHVHSKLSDIRRLCEGCLLSFATENKSNRETYRSLVGILGADLECSVEEDHKIHLRLPAEKKNQLLMEISSVHRCSCCGEPLRVKASFPQSELVQDQTVNGGIFPQAPASSPRVFGLVKNNESRGISPLPHVRYSELKYSDTESEIPEEEDTTGKEDPKVGTVLLTDNEDPNEYTCKTPKTPSYIRASRFLNFALCDSTTASPRAPERHFRRFLAEKAEGNADPSELNNSSESEGDIIVSHLQKQVRLDRKSLIALYMELDEERSASAIAANQAMAMITRVQAEKAALQMEALQYQRMMEEQAEYDQEAVQVLKDLLAKRDEDIKSLEVELRNCKERLGEDVYDIEEFKSRADDDYQKIKLLRNMSISQVSECGSPPENFCVEDFKSPSQSGTSQVIDQPLLDQESERLYLLERLRVLEKIYATKSGDQSESLSQGDGGDYVLTKEISNLSKRLEAIENDREGDSSTPTRD